MSQRYYHRNNCRLCNSISLDLVLKMAPCPPVDAFLEPTDAESPQHLYPMDLYLCATCGHAQLLDVVSPDILFGNYIYTTSSSPGLVEYFSHYADSVFSALALKSGDRMLDIGSNDGTLLRFFQKKGLDVFGVDPASEIAAEATHAGIPTLADFFNSTTAKTIRSEQGLMKLITANNVFAHSDTLGDMLDGVKHLLSSDGTFVFEVSYLLDLVEGKVFDFIYHEHLGHHSVKPLKSFLANHGMTLTHVERTASKGGSIRCFGRHADTQLPPSASVEELIAVETQAGLYDLNTYQELTAELEATGQTIRHYLQELHNSGAKIAAYGASATGTVLLHHFDIGRYISFIIDDNPVRQGRLSPGHLIPVISFDTFETKHIQHVLILAWRFADMIVKSRKGFLDKGGEFIVPLPEFNRVNS